jgi:hypothetical protein
MRPNTNIPQLDPFPAGLTLWLQILFGGGQGRNRTTDTRIFSRASAVPGAYYSTTCSACQPHSQAHPGTITAHPILVRHILGTACRHGRLATTLPFSQTYSGVPCIRAVRRAASPARSSARSTRAASLGFRLEFPVFLGAFAFMVKDSASFAGLPELMDTAQASATCPVTSSYLRCATGP